jgi:hypothetical protein
MRRPTGVKAIAALAVAAFACAGVILAQSALADLGLSEATTKADVNSWLSSGYLNVSGAAKSFKAAAPAARVVLVKGLMAWAKAYTESAAFKADYDKRRQADTPTPPLVVGTVDDELARQRAERQKMTPEMRKSMEETIKQVEASYRKADSDPQMVALTRQMIELQRASEQDAYKKRVAAHEQRFPPNPKTLVARRLQEFLDVSKDVDFTAKLVLAGSKMRFADPRYEEKPPAWKLCYRAGRDVVTAAREAAQAWLKAL